MLAKEGVDKNYSNNRDIAMLKVIKNSLVVIQ